MSMTSVPHSGTTNRQLAKPCRSRCRDVSVAVAASCGAGRQWGTNRLLSTNGIELAIPDSQSQNQRPGVNLPAFRVQAGGVFILLRPRFKFGLQHLAKTACKDFLLSDVCVCVCVRVFSLHMHCSARLQVCWFKVTNRHRIITLGGPTVPELVQDQCFSMGGGGVGGDDLLCFNIHYDEAFRQDAVDEFNTGEHTENTTPVTRNSV